jgi:hypothetical protein
MSEFLAERIRIMSALNYKKEYKDLYGPGPVPSLIKVPAMRFIMVDGKGDPNEEVARIKKEGLLIDLLAVDKLLGFSEERVSDKIFEFY